LVLSAPVAELNGQIYAVLRVTGCPFGAVDGYGISVIMYEPDG
jgi:hypothetical protein